MLLTLKMIKNFAMLVKSMCENSIHSSYDFEELFVAGLGDVHAGGEVALVIQNCGTFV